MSLGDTGEVGDPEDTTAIDRMDVAEVLEGWWWAPSEDEFAEDEELREMFAPFGTRFPGLAPGIEEELDPELMAGSVPVLAARADRAGARGAPGRHPPVHRLGGRL